MRHDTMNPAIRNTDEQGRFGFCIDCANMQPYAQVYMTNIKKTGGTVVVTFKCLTKNLL